jgi:Flp pilus assembly protein TadB
MKVKQLSVFAVSAGMVLSALSLSALPAHAADNDASASAPAMSKQQQKAQKKADRQARRAKKNAELSKLEKNGYNPAGNQTNYPQNLQNAQQKAAGQKPTNAPAVAP